MRNGEKELMEKKRLREMLDGGSALIGGSGEGGTNARVCPILCPACIDNGHNR